MEEMEKVGNGKNPNSWEDDLSHAMWLICPSPVYPLKLTSIKGYYFCTLIIV
jgi:hypothetical protein